MRKQRRQEGVRPQTQFRFAGRLGLLIEEVNVAAGVCEAGFPPHTTLTLASMENIVRGLVSKKKKRFCDEVT